MTITKAIELLTITLKPSNPHPSQDLEDAIKLGVEALDFIYQWRKALPLDNPQLLPGETEE